MFFDNMKSIAEDLAKYSNLTREQIFTLFIKDKLDSQLKKYMHTLGKDAAWADTISFGQAKVELFKRITKIQTKDAENATKDESEN